MCNVVQYFCNHCHMLKDINITYITLIPKINNPITVTPSRLTSLCNISYKIITKILTNRLKRVLPKIISPSRDASI